MVPCPSTRHPSLPKYSEKAGVEITHGILTTRYYDEAVLGKVGASAAEILGKRTSQLEIQFDKTSVFDWIR